jgi:hypothetical protein
LRGADVNLVLSHEDICSLYCSYVGLQKNTLALQPTVGQTLYDDTVDGSGSVRERYSRAGRVMDAWTYVSFRISYDRSMHAHGKYEDFSNHKKS